MTRPDLLIAGLLLASAIVLAARLAFFPSRQLPKHRVRHMRFRLRLRLRPGHGHASAAELWLRWGRLASYRESGRTRPSLTRSYRLTHARSHAFCLGTAHLLRRLWVTVQEHGLLIGPPRSMKSALLSAVILDAPGAVVSTSTKGDIFDLTAAYRQGIGPVFTFNPQRIAGIVSTVRWSPLAGCDDPATAIRRGAAFGNATSTKGAEDEAFWRREASFGLQGLFSAAELAQQNMRRVGRWVGATRETPEAVAILEAAERSEWASKLAELNGPAERTAQTIRTVMSSALAFLHDPELAATVMPGPGQQFDIDQFLLRRGTLYLICRGDDQDAVLAPLYAALAAEIQHRAVQLGAFMPGRRLDPPLLLALDELTQTCPVPVHKWLADSGGQGVSIWCAVHGLSQLVERYGPHAAQSILDTTNVKVYMPGLADPDTLSNAARLAGHAAHREAGSDTFGRHEVMSPDMIRMLPAGWALVLRGAHHPVLARVARGWKHKGARKLARSGATVALAVPEVVSITDAPAVRDIGWPGQAAAAVAPAEPFEPAAVLAASGNGHKNGQHPWSAR